MSNGYFHFRGDMNNSLKFAEKIEWIYLHIKDDTSKRIFENCLMYSLTCDAEFIRRNIMLTEIGKKFDERLQQLSENDLYIYGAGKRGEALLETFPDKNWKGYIDNLKTGYCHNYLIMNSTALRVDKKTSIVISNFKEYEKIKLELLEKGICDKNIIVLEEWNMEASKYQYFENRCIDKNRLKTGFVDAGCFDGKDSIQYCNWIGNQNADVWAFEPDKIQYQICQKNLSVLTNAKIYNIGLSDSFGQKMMTMTQDRMSKITEDGEVEVNIEALDNILKNKSVGYIKMDIEGFEANALKGAEHLIREKKPALAICVYHKKEDIWDIPRILLEYNPDYCFSFGHYKLGQVETVLYAF